MLKKISYDIPGEISTNVLGNTVGNVLFHAEIKIPDSVIDSPDLLQKLDRLFRSILTDVEAQVYPEKQSRSYSPLQVVSDAAKEAMSGYYETKPNL